MHKRNIVIQGAARGLGRAFAEKLVARDDVNRLFVTARDPRANDLPALVERGRGKVQSVPLDITDETSIKRAADDVASVVERLDMVIVCAGLLHDREGGMRPEKRFADIDSNNLARAFEVNASGPLLMLKHWAGLLTHGERAVFASLSARVGSISDNHLGGWYAYRASKAAQNQFTRTAAIELRRQSRQLICVGLHPGTTDTALSKPFQRNVPDGKLFTPEFAATRLLSVLAGLTPDDSGDVFDWDGKHVPA